MAFKRADRNVYYTELSVGPVTLPRLSTGFQDRESAEQLETALRTAWQWGHADLIERVATKAVKLSDVWRAWNSPDPRQEFRKLEGVDPTLADEVAYMQGLPGIDPRVRDGLKLILKYAPEGATRNWLMEPTNITALYRKAGEDRSQGTVYRSIHRAVADLLTERIGRSKMLAIMADVRKPRVSDTRAIVLSRTQIQKLVYNAPPELMAPLATAVLTGVDQGPMLDMKVADWDPPNLWVPDGKNVTRPRSLPLEKGMANWVDRMASGKAPGDSLTGLTQSTLRDLWEALRESQGMRTLRWKDLRGVCATWAHRCAWDALRIQMWLGHSGPTMTRRYIKKVELLPREPRPLSEAMGIEATVADLLNSPDQDLRTWAIANLSWLRERIP